MFRLIQVTLPGFLFFLIVLQYKYARHLQSENEALRAKITAYENSPDNQYKTAMKLLSEGKSTEAVSKLKTVSQQFPQSEVSKEAQKKAKELELQAARARAAELAKQAKQKNKKDLENFLNENPASEKSGAKPPADLELTVASCRPLEADPSKYAGKRVLLTAKLEKLDSSYSFTDCSGIRISTERMSKELLQDLRSSFGAKETAAVTLAGEYSGLVFYPDSIK